MSFFSSSIAATALLDQYLPDHVKEYDFSLVWDGELGLHTFIYLYNSFLFLIFIFVNKSNLSMVTGH